MIRIILGIAAGIIVTGLTIGAAEALAHSLFTVPAENSPLPNDMLLLVVGAYFLGALAGGVVAGLIARTSWPAWAIAGFVIAGAIWSYMLITHPAWMMIAGVIAPLLGGLVASHIVQRVLLGRGDAGARA